MSEQDLEEKKAQLYDFIADKQRDIQEYAKTLQYPTEESFTRMTLLKIVDAIDDITRSYDKISDLDSGYDTD